MLVLREDLQEGVGRQVRADRLERQACRRLTLDPEIHRGNPVALLDHRVGKVELAIEFERSRLNRQCARGGTGLCRFVDDAYLDSELGEPERQNEARGAPADDQDVAAHQFVLYL